MAPENSTNKFDIIAMSSVERKKYFDEILPKDYKLKSIENEINDMLHIIPNLKIKISNIKNKIDIQYNPSEGRPLNIKMASYNEQFLIELFIKIILNKYSVITKAKFIIINDYGRALVECFKDINTIMNHINDQYDNVIIIDRFDKIEQAKYKIVLNKNIRHVNNTSDE